MKDSLAQRLKVTLEYHGLSVREAAEIAQVSPSTLHSWLAGASPKNFEAVLKIATECDCSLSWLLTGKEEAHRSVNVYDVFEADGILFEGFAEVLIKKLVKKQTTKGE